MKSLLSFFSTTSLLLLTLAEPAFANGDSHPPGTPHTEEATSIDPVIVVGIAIVLVIGGFILWKFVLHGPKSSLPNQLSSSEKPPPVQEKNVSQSNLGDNPPKNG